MSTYCDGDQLASNMLQVCHWLRTHTHLPIRTATKGGQARLQHHQQQQQQQQQPKQQHQQQNKQQQQHHRQRQHTTVGCR
ncbi:ras-related protein RabY-like [Drosophila simulans]|nr:ras-related protein RabY-like [Drosophila simulans]